MNLENKKRVVVNFAVKALEPPSDNKQNKICNEVIDIMKQYNIVRVMCTVINAEKIVECKLKMLEGTVEQEEKAVRLFMKILTKHSVNGFYLDLSPTEDFQSSMDKTLK